MFGFLNVNKPVGPTSHNIVARIRRSVGRKVKVGHAGTLDPLADGVLVICLGPATRLADYVQSQPKRYVAEIVLGATSTTDDREGQITPTPNARLPSAEAVQGALGRFAGPIQQAPPAYSAVHVQGRRAYKLARAGDQPDLPPRTVTVHEIQLAAYEPPRLRIDVRCGSGTYIRSLARDIGQALGVGGYCSALTRTEVGRFRIDDARPPDELNPARDLLSPLLALADLPKLTVDAAGAEQIRNGRQIDALDGVPAGEVALLGEDGGLLAIAVAAPGGEALQPTKVFCARSPSAG